ncbi:MAG: N(6)-L-threonylcarbamoyladenine synthase, TsaB subunit [Candidatus Westeberhardia cardiocondylae]|nr:N(6)-L-threonylcarbamoyladenine synthase, TsaB subunit [Candidatus Westeberhardia cardiocondylae]
MNKEYIDNILAIETTTQVCSASLMKKNSIFNREIMSNSEHTKYILQIIDELLKEANITINNIDYLACSHGPGSFTGIRIGISVIHGIAFKINTPVVGISTMMTLAEGVWRCMQYSKVLIIMHAKQGMVYFAKYIRNNNGIWIGKNSETIIKVKKIQTLLKNLSGKWIVVGVNLKNDQYIFNQISQYAYINNIYPNAQDVISLVKKQLCYKKIKQKTTIKPVYLLNI